MYAFDIASDSNLFIVSFLFDIQFFFVVTRIQDETFCIFLKNILTKQKNSRINVDLGDFFIFL